MNYPIAAVCAVTALWLSISTATVVLSAEDVKVVTTYRLTDFLDAGDFRITTLHGRPSNSALKDGVLTADFSAKPGYVGIGLGIGPVVGNPTQVTLKLESNASGHPIVLRLQDSKGQFFQREVTRLDADGLRTIEVPLADMGKWFHFGGPNDGIVRPPVRVTEVIVDHDGIDTSVRFIELTATTEITLDQGIDFRLTGREPKGNTEQLVLECRNILPKDVSARCDWKITDLFGRALDEGRNTLSLPANRRTEWRLSVPVRDISLCTFDLTATVPMSMVDAQPVRPLNPGVRPDIDVQDSMDIKRSVSTSVVRLTNRFSRANELLGGSPFGLGIYLGQRYSVPEMEKSAQMAQDIGVKWIRDEFNWSHVEPRKGEWHWESYDASVDACTRHGISVFGLLCYWSPWAKPHTEEGVGDYCNYVRAVVGRYKDRVKYWEIWNEPNIGFWTGTVEQYADLMKAAYDAVKEADPSAKVIGCCTAGTDLGFIEKVFKQGGFDKMDILSIHPYRYPRTPEESDLIGELKRADALVHKYGKPKEIWITEMGWPTHTGGGGSSEAKQAAMIVRSYIQSIVSGVVQKVFWYDYRNDGLDPYYNEHNFGIIRRDLSLKPASVAFGAMTGCLEGREFVRDLKPGKGACAYLFEGKGGRTIAAWSVSGNGTLEVSGRSSDLGLTDLVGHTTTLRGSEIEVPISELPLFISGVSANVTVRVTLSAAPESEQAAPVRVEVRPLSLSKFEVGVSRQDGGFLGHYQ